MNISFNSLLNEDGTNSPNQKEAENAKNKLEPIRINLENKLSSLLKETEDQYGIFIFPNVENKKINLRFLVDPKLSKEDLFLV